MNQKTKQTMPPKSVRMSLHLLGLMIINGFIQFNHRLRNVVWRLLVGNGINKYCVHGHLPRRIDKDASYCTLDDIIKIAQQSEAPSDDVYFDTNVKKGHQCQTVRLFGIGANRYQLEVLPSQETQGVYIKSLNDQQLRNELEMLTTNKDKAWFDQHQYSYTPW